MQFFVQFVICGLVLVQGFLWRDSSPLFTSNYNIYKLTDKTFYPTVNTSENIWLIDFYAPWCPHCRHFAPEWELIGNYYAESNRIRVGVVDCTKNRMVCTAERIFAYPGIKAFNIPETGAMPHVQRNPGQRHADGIAQWVEYLLAENKLPKLDMKGTPSEMNLGVARVIPEPQDAKHAAKASRLQRMNDGALALMSSLKQGFFLGTPVLEHDRLTAAAMWLNVVATVFPLTQNQKALQYLNSTIVQKKKWTFDEWVAVLDSWSVSNVVSETAPSTLFTRKLHEWDACISLPCGYWILFHLLIANSLQQSVKMHAEIVASIREFVRYFFGCEECIQHFLEANPPHVITDIAVQGDDSHFALSMWLFRMHNSVNERLGHPLWPSISDCRICFNIDGNSNSSAKHEYNEEQVYQYLQTMYFVPQSEAIVQNKKRDVHFTGYWIFQMIAFGVIVGILIFRSPTFFRRCCTKRRHIA